MMRCARWRAAVVVGWRSVVLIEGARAAELLVVAPARAEVKVLKN